MSQNDKILREEFEKLVSSLDAMSRGPKAQALSQIELEVLAFDLEQRHALAKVRSWLKTEEGLRSLMGKSPEPLKEESNREEEPVSNAEGHTAKQQELAEKLKKRKQSKNQ